MHTRLAAQGKPPTKHELLVQAKELGVRGCHRMKTVELTKGIELPKRHNDTGEEYLDSLQQLFLTKVRVPYKHISRHLKSLEGRQRQ